MAALYNRLAEDCNIDSPGRFVFLYAPKILT